MMIRTKSRTVTFLRPFKLSAMDRAHAAGSYVVETDEELLEGPSFPAYRRTATYIVLFERSGGEIASQFLKIDPVELQAALDSESAAAPAKTGANDGTGLTDDARGPIAIIKKPIRGKRLAPEPTAA